MEPGPLVCMEGLGFWTCNILQLCLQLHMMCVTLLHVPCFNMCGLFACVSRPGLTNSDVLTILAKVLRKPGNGPRAAHEGEVLERLEP